MFSKKTAVAAATLLAAFAAQAQVTVYGSLDEGFGRFERSGSDGVTALESGIMSASFLGFKGSEDLGGGLKATFRLESLLAEDTGSVSSTNFWSRNATIGLAGDFGAVTLGRTQTVYFDSIVAYNPFGESRVSPTMNLAADARAWNNAITYTTPNLSGFTGAVQYGVKEADANGANLGLSLNYAAGPLGLGFAYESVKTGLPVDTKDVRFVFGGSYDFGVVKAYAQLGQDKITVPAGSSKTNFFQIGAGVPVSAQGTVLASFGHLKNKDFDVKERILSLGYDHSLSKRTGVYAVFSSDKITDEDTGNTFVVGVRHRF